MLAYSYSLSRMLVYSYSLFLSYSTLVIREITVRHPLKTKQTKQNTSLTKPYMENKKTKKA